MSVSKKKGDNLEKHLIKNLAVWYNKTLSIEEAANKIDLDQQTAVNLSGRKEFKEALAQINPELLKSWEESSLGESVGAHVREQAKADGMKFYNMMVKDLEDLGPKDRIPLLEKLLRLGEYFEKAESRETITLAPSAIAAINRATTEMDTPMTEIKSPYDKH